MPLACGQNKLAEWPIRAACIAPETSLSDFGFIPMLKIDFEVPMTVDLGFTYLRQDQNGVLLGIYEIDYEHWAMDGAPWDYGMELFQEQTDRIEHELTMGFERYPVLRRWASKPGLMALYLSPDGNPLVGPVPGKPGIGVPVR